MLCRQFWSIEQMLKFNEKSYLRRLNLYSPILDHLAKHADNRLENSHDKNLVIGFIKKVSE